MKNIIKKILKEEFRDKRKEKFYQIFESYINKKYHLINGHRFYNGNVINVYTFQVWELEDYEDTFDVKLNGTIFNNPATIDIKEKFGLSPKEFKEFLLRYIDDYK